MASDDTVTWRHWVTRLGLPLILLVAVLVAWFVPATATTNAVLRVVVGVVLLVVLVRIGLQRSRRSQR